LTELVIWSTLMYLPDQGVNSTKSGFFKHSALPGVTTSNT
jgi:hypothetical protein